MKGKSNIYNQIANAVGYRFELVSGTFPTQVKSGSTYCAEIKVKNTGSTTLIYKRPVQVYSIHVYNIFSVFSSLENFIDFQTLGGFTKHSK